MRSLEKRPVPIHLVAYNLDKEERAKPGIQDLKKIAEESKCQY